MDKATVLCGLLALAAALPALDAALRLRRLVRGRGAPERGMRPARLLVLVPARAEGARVGDIAADVTRESEKEISSKVKIAGGAEASASSFAVDILVLLDGPDPEAQARLARDGISYLSKNLPGPAKGHALAFLAASMGDRLDAYDFILVFDADMRLPERFFRDLAVPVGTEAFQLPVRPAGVPASGAPRVEALSLAQALEDDLARDAEGLPVRLRGKAMGFSPRAFHAGPAVATATTVEDSEATLRLLASGVRVRALAAPVAFDEPVPGSRAMSGSRARWLGGHMKLLFTGLGDLLRIAAKSPKGAFVLAADLWLRPRVLLLGTLAILAGASDVLMLVLSLNGRPVALLAFLILLSLEAKLALVLEWLSIAALRRRLGYPPEVPPVAFADFAASFSMWTRAAARALLAPSRWHRARPPA